MMPDSVEPRPTRIRGTRPRLSRRLLCQCRRPPKQRLLSLRSPLVPVLFADGPEVPAQPAVCQEVEWQGPRRR